MKNATLIIKNYKHPPMFKIYELNQMNEYSSF